MAETAYSTHYMGSKRRKPKRTAMSGYGGGNKKLKQVKSKARRY